MNYRILILFTTLLSGLIISSCGGGSNNKEESNKNNSNNLDPITKRQLGKDEQGIAIAYYNQDSIATNFKFYREIESMLKSKEQAYHNELEKRVRAYQTYEAEVQKRYDNNEITGYEVESIQRTMLEKQQAIQQYELTQGEALQKETLQYQTALMNKVAEAGKEFSNKKGIDLLFYYQKGGQITFINNAFDVTLDFISFLNEREEKLKSGGENGIDK